MTIALAQALGAAIARDWHGDFDAVQRAALADIVRTAFIDTAACVLAAREEPATRAVAAWARQRGGTPRAAILFGAERLPAAAAALVNGVAGHALDYDDVGLAGHPSGVLVPALWAECEAGGPTGFALVQAYAKGYAVWGELQRRLRVPLHARGWHPSAVFGVVAAAAAVAALRGLDAGQAAHALGVAASQAGGVVANFGSMTKPLHVGRAAEGGIAAVDLVLQGLDASADALDGPAGLLAALGGTDNADLASPCADDLATTLLRQRPGIKQYPVCYAAHRSVDAVLDLAREHGLAAGYIAAIDATISETTVGVLRHHAPAQITTARFSLEFALAAALVRGRLGLAEVAPATLADPRVQALMPRVRTHTVRTSCPLEPSFAYTDQVRITLHDGRVLDSGPVRFARGHAQRPLSEAQLHDKLVSCVGPDEQALAADVQRRIASALA